MRFGITPLQFSDIKNLITENGSVDLTKFDFSQVVMHAIKEGFHHMELTLDIGYLLPGSLNKEKMERLAEMSEEEGITYSVHLPFMSIEPASPNEYIRKASLKSLVHSIEVARILEPECYVLHSTVALAAGLNLDLNLPENYKECVNRNLLSHSAKSVDEILSKTDIPSRKLALENVIFPFELAREIVDQYDLSICFDTGHLLAGYSGKQSVIGFLKAHWDRIVELHLHDGFHRRTDGNIVRRDHLPIGDGNLPISELMDYLDEKGFKGPIVFELTFDEAKRSLETIRERCPRVDVE